MLRSPIVFRKPFLRRPVFRSWIPPLGCTVPWGARETSFVLQNINNFPSDKNVVYIEKGGTPSQPLFITGRTKKAIFFDPFVSYVILDKMTINPIQDKDFAWKGGAIFIQEGCHHIAIRKSRIWASRVDAESTFRTLILLSPKETETIHDVTVLGCNLGPNGDWKRNEGSQDFGGVLFPAGCHHVSIFDTYIHDIGGDAAACPNEWMRKSFNVSEPTRDVQIGRCNLTRCRENHIDMKLVQGAIISQNLLKVINPNSESSRGDSINATHGAYDDIVKERGSLPWVSSDKVWIIQNQIRNTSRGLYMIAAREAIHTQGGTMYSLGNTFSNVRGGLGGGIGLLAWNNTKIISYKDKFINVTKKLEEHNNAQIIFEPNTISTSLQDEFFMQFGRFI